METLEDLSIEEYLEKYDYEFYSAIKIYHADDEKELNKALSNAQVSSGFCYTLVNQRVNHFLNRKMHIVQLRDIHSVTPGPSLHSFRNSGSEFTRGPRRQDFWEIERTA